MRISTELRSIHVGDEDEYKEVTGHPPAQSPEVMAYEKGETPGFGLCIEL